MAWQEELGTMLRVLLDDCDDEQTYSDSRLEQLLVLAARYVQQEVSFSTTYTISMTSVTISPDPTVTATLDDAFSNFTVLKAACLMDWNTFRQKALVAGVKARCGPAILETTEHMRGFKDLVTEGPCKAYNTLKDEYQFGNIENIRAVLSPFRGNNFDPSSLGGYRRHNHGR